MRSKKIYRLKQMQYFLITIGCVTFFTIQALKTFQEYLRKEKGTRIEFSFIKDVQFPTLTICPLESYNENVIKSHGLKGINDYRYVWIRGLFFTASKSKWNKVQTTPNKSMNARKYDRSQIKPIFCHKGPLEAIKGHTRP